MPFTVTKNIRLNMLRPELTVVHGKQYDNSSRIITAQLYEDNTKWVAPAGVLGVISYIKPDGNYGFYDETDLGETAVVFNPNDRSIVTLILSTQALTAAGKVKVEVNFYDQQNARRLSSFAFTLDVEKSTITQDDLTSSSEFRLLAEQITQVLTAAANLAGLTADAETIAAGSEADVVVTGGSEGVPYNLSFKIPQGDKGEKGNKGDKGDTGNAITGIALVSGNHAAGTYDTYRVTFSETSAFDFQVYNGANGSGAVSTVNGIQPVGEDVTTVIIGSTAPTTSTVGSVKQMYYDTTNGILYVCTAVSGNTYTWLLADASLATDVQALQQAAANKVLYLTSVSITATTGDIATVSDARITADHVLAESVYANPSYITTDVTWTTASGSLVLNGTCTAATTANIVLIKKDN